ncbi:MAG: acyltransferase [Alcaligenaceae bacterium]|nr:MAG: acyltransferase [Alcaligenaceae bacterium]
MRECKLAISHDEFLKTRNFAALDGLRAIAVFLVFGFHFGGYVWWNSYAGWLGVYAFFVLSGFLITTLLLRERDATGAVSLTAFYIRRSTRILPLYYLVYFVVLGLTYAAQAEAWDRMVAATPYYLTFMNEIAPFASLAQSWTLGIEWKFYLLWPALFVLFSASIASRFGLVVGCIAALMVLMLTQLQPSWLLPWHYLGLLIGAAMAIVMHTRSTFGWVRFLMTQTAAIVLVVLLCIVHRRALYIVSKIGNPEMIVIYCVLIALLLPALVANTYVKRALSSRFLVFVGRRSYGMYLIQYPAALAAAGLSKETFPEGWPLVFGSFAVALVAADFLYRWFEKPLTDWGHRWAKAAKQRAMLPPKASVSKINGSKF